MVKDNGHGILFVAPREGRVSRNLLRPSRGLCDIVAPREGRVSRNLMGQKLCRPCHRRQRQMCIRDRNYAALVIVAPREGRVSRNLGRRITFNGAEVAPREGRVSRNCDILRFQEIVIWSRPARGV